MEETGWASEALLSGSANTRIAAPVDRLPRPAGARAAQQNPERVFSVDDLNRLTQSQVSGQTARTVTYNNIGNILTKDGVSYTYSASRPHAVSRAGTIDYSYDANGNVTQHGDNSVWWTPFNQPLSLFTGDNAYTFFYDNDHGRVLESIFEGGAKKINIFAGGLHEEVIEEGVTTRRHFIPTPSGVAGIYRTQDATTERVYLHGDHLGSSSVVTNASGTVVESYSFDAWGAPRNAATWVSDLSEWPSYEGDRGFTGHEMLASLELVHMNARIYDPALGRFLSADPIIQAEGDLQNYNRYSYVINNPLKYTDPSGNIFGFIGFLIGASFFVEINVGVIIAASLFNAVVQGAISGGFSGAIRGLALAGISIAISSGIGGFFNAENVIDTVTNIRDFNFIELARAFTHGITQGGLSELAGGDFRTGFAGAFAGSIVGSLQGAGVGRKFFGLPRVDKNKIVARTVAAGIVGGTVSRIGGGKFANGAVTAAMVHLFNAESPALRQKKETEAALAAINEKLKFIETVKEIYTQAYNELLKEGSFTVELIPGKPFTMPVDGVALNMRVYDILGSRGTEFIKGGSTLGVDIQINVGNPKGNLTERIIYKSVMVHESSHRNAIINMARTKSISTDAAFNQILGSLKLSYFNEINAYNRRADYLRRTAATLRGQ